MRDFLKVCDEFVGWVLGVNSKPKKGKRKSRVKKNK